MKHKYIIYGLADPRTGECRYIGRSSSGVYRANMHARRVDKDRTHKGAWVRQLQRLGLRFEVVVLEETTQERLNEAERHWIAYGRAQGWPLTNHTDGGYGHSGATFSQEHREKISKANKGRVLTPEQRARISEAAKQRPPVSSETRRKIGLAGRGRKHTAEHNAKIGLGNQKKKIWSDEAKANFTRLKGRPIVETTTGQEFVSIQAAAAALQVHPASIDKVVSGKHKSTKQGYIFRYLP